MKEKWKGVFPEFFNLYVKIHACDKRSFLISHMKAKIYTKELVWTKGKKTSLQYRKTEGSVVLQTHGINGFGLSWGMLLIFLCVCLQNPWLERK